MNSLNSTSDAVVDHVGLYTFHYPVFMHLTLSLEQTSMTEFEPEEQLALYPLLYLKSSIFFVIYYIFVVVGIKPRESHMVGELFLL